MSTEPKPAPPHPALLWTGRIVSALPVALLLFSASMKFLPMPPETAKQAEEFGWSPGLMIPLGITELVCTILYAIPQTSVLGAILLTGYMGGAIAAHLRVGDAFFFQAGVAVVVWLGLYLREPRLWKLMPWRS